MKNPSPEATAAADGLGPAEGFLDHLPAPQAHRVALAAGGTSIDGAAACLTRYMGTNPEALAGFGELGDVVALVGTDSGSRFV